MPKATKKVDTVVVDFKSKEGHLFEDVLLSEDVDQIEQRIRGRDIELQILEKNNQYIIGLVITSKRHNTPPKRNKSKRINQSLGLTNEEALAYANIFLYEKKRHLLMYEVNKNGCYLDYFAQYLYKCAKNGDTELGDMDIKFTTLLSKGSYERAITMDSYKSFEFHIANPAELLTVYKHKNDAVYSTLTSAAAMNSEKAIIKYEVDMRGKAKFASRGLLSTPVGVTLRRLQDLMVSKFGKNIKKVEVVGYEQDSEDGRLHPIDLVADKFPATIKLDEPKDNKDLLETQRQMEIKALYQKSKKDFDYIFKQDE